MTPSVAAIVVTYRTGPRLRECLYALASDPAVGEVVVVDNGNAAADEAWLDDFASTRAGVAVLRPGENLGFARACNLGARKITADHLLFINPDAVLRRGSVQALQAAAADLPSPWIVGGRLYGLDGREQRGARRRKLTLPIALATFTGLSRLPGVADFNRTDEPPPAAPTPMDVISGALFLADRAGFAALGRFDEGYFLHVEDIDLCRRAWEAGGAVAYQPQAGALHYGSTSEVSSVFVERHKARGLGRYFRKFARNPAERIVAAVASSLFHAMLVGRARLRRASH